MLSLVSIASASCNHAYGDWTYIGAQDKPLHAAEQLQYCKIRENVNSRKCSTCGGTDYKYAVSSETKHTFEQFDSTRTICSHCGFTVYSTQSAEDAAAQPTADMSPNTDTPGFCM